MSNKSDTFNIDDLLRMPDMANSFNNTARFNDFSENDNFDTIKDEEISIDSLLGINKTPEPQETKIEPIINNKEETPIEVAPIVDNYKTIDLDNLDLDFSPDEPVIDIPQTPNLFSEEEKFEAITNDIEVNEEPLKVAPPPPPPIPKKVEPIEPVVETKTPQVEDFDFSFVENTREFQPSVTSAIDLDEFDFNFDSHDEIEFNTISENIDEAINLESQNDYYKNIVDNQDIKNDSQYTRIYFDQEEIETKLSQMKPSQNVKVEEPVTLDNITPINVDEEVTEVKEKKLSKRQQNKLFHKQNISKVPAFYRFEYINAKANWWISFALILVTILTFSLTSYAIFSPLGYSEWLYLPNCLLAVGTISYFILSTIKSRSMIKEMRLHSYEFTKEDALPSINRIYKKLITSNYYLNWGAASIYVISGLLILLTFIVVYFVNVFDHGSKGSTFGDLVCHYIPWVDNKPDYANVVDDNAAYIVVWTFAAICFLMVFLQMLCNPLNVYRRNQIEVFYGKTLISEEMIAQSKKNANRKGLAMFIGSTLVVSFFKEQNKDYSTQSYFQLK